MQKTILFIFILFLIACGQEQSDEANTIHFLSGDLKLKGSLSLPEGEPPFPTIVFVHGSGSLDRDQTIVLDGEDAKCIYPNLKNDTLQMFKDLAEGFVEEGIAVLRYDKRNYTHSSINNDIGFTPDDLIADAHAALNYLKTQPQVDLNRLMLLGHSQGGNLIPIVARERKDVQAMIALAPTAQRVDSNFLHQIKTLEKECPELEAWKDFGYDTAAVAFQKILQDSMDMETPLFGWYPAYWKRWMQVTDSTIHHYNQTDQPTLFLYGTKDFNIPLENARRLESNLKKDSFELYRLRRLTHYFTTHSDAELAPAAVDTIVHWLQDKELITNLNEQ